MASGTPKPFSLSLSNPTARKDSIETNNNKRRLAALGSGDDSDSDHDTHRGKVQLISGFGHQHGGASGKDKQGAAPLVIPALTNRDWRREAELRRGNRKTIYIPDEAKRDKLKGEDVSEVDNTGAGETYGLQIFEKGEQKVLAMEIDEETVPNNVLTEDEVAIAALMGAEKRGNDMVIAHTSGTTDWRDARSQGNEDDAYRNDVDSRPDVPTLEDYAAVPVEDFGAALLRGMGWKGGEELGAKGNLLGNSGKLRLVAKRPAFLGIGAKPVTDIPELGAWGKGDKRKGRPDTTYIPVVKVDKKTGKIVDDKQGGSTRNQEELKRRGAGGMEKKGADWRERSNERERDRGGRYEKKYKGRDGDHRGRNDDTTGRRRRDGSSERSERDKARYRENGRESRGGNRDRDRDRDRDRRRDRGGGMEVDRRKYNHDKDYGKRGG